MKVGRPPKRDERELAELVKLFEEYVETHEFPVVSEFAYLNSIDRTDLYNRKEYSTVLKKSQAKKEAYLEIYGIHNKINPTMAIFSLKQMGWSDKQEVKIKEHNIESTSKLSDETLRTIKKELKNGNTDT